MSTRLRWTTHLFTALALSGSAACGSSGAVSSTGDSSNFSPDGGDGQAEPGGGFASSAGGGDEPAGDPCAIVSCQPDQHCTAVNGQGSCVNNTCAAARPSTRNS